MSNYYVYNHVDADGSIVYVGKGRYDRAWSINRSNPAHVDWIKEQLPFLNVIIVHSGLEEQNALDLEKTMIRVVQPKFNVFHTDAYDTRLAEQGSWLAQEKSRFGDSELQTALGRRAARSEKHPNNVLHTCVHCGATMNVGHINRYHNNNCKKRVITNAGD